MTSTARTQADLSPSRTAVNVTRDSFNWSLCKYHDRGSNQCYYSDDHLRNEIWAFLKPSVTEWVFLALYLFCFALGLVGNGLVVWSVVRNSHLRSTTNVLLTNLALADFLAVLVCMPPNFVQTIWETWFLGKAMCKLVEYYQDPQQPRDVLRAAGWSVQRTSNERQFNKTWHSLHYDTYSLSDLNQE